MNTEVLARVYDELLRIKGFGVNGGMTPANLKVAYDLALQNNQIDRPVPIDKWADFRFQQRSIETSTLIWMSPVDRRAIHKVEGGAVS